MWGKSLQAKASHDDVEAGMQMGYNGPDGAARASQSRWAARRVYDGNI
jgi:hypothetical protein